jgi:uncharacterized BrkB/YihY/UPF0761 family membrane protein
MATRTKKTKVALVPMEKPWWQSMSITGALMAGFGIVTSPAVLAVLPQNIATLVTTVGGVASAIGLRRALP